MVKALLPWCLSQSLCHWYIGGPLIFSYSLSCYFAEGRYQGSLVEFLGSLVCIVISSPNKDPLAPFFGTWIPSIFSCLTTLAKAWCTVLNDYGESGQPCLVSYFSGVVLHFWVDIGYGLAVNSLLYLGMSFISLISGHLSWCILY